MTTRPEIAAGVPPIHVLECVTKIDKRFSVKESTMQIDLNDEAGRPVNPIVDLLRREIERRQPASIDEANVIAAEVSQRHNRTVQDEMGDTSPEQAHTLIRPGWMEQALALNDRISLQELAAAPLLQNARRVLLAARELGVVGATATGAFNRKFASRMFEEFEIPAIKREFTLRYNKVINQRDVPFLELFRDMLPQAGLLLFRKGVFRLTKRANGLLADSAIGELYALLFRTFFLQINLAALDGLPDASQVQDTIGFAFYQISRRADSWTEVADIAPKLFLPAVRDSLPSLPALECSAYDYARIRILRSLKDFGLLEYEPDHPWTSPERIRKSSLFDRFIRFTLPPALE
jgi:hypothetical protein